MAPCAQFGIETGDQHFTRPSFPLQGWLSWTNDMTPDAPNPIKTVTHVFGQHGEKANHHFTLSAFGMWLNRQVDENAYDSARLRKMVIVSDGCAGQNWSHQVFGHLVRLVNNMKVCPGRFFPELKELIVVKTVAGHGMIYSQYTLTLCLIGKSELDGEFSHPKGVVREKSYHGGAVGPTPANPTTGLGTATALMDHLTSHRLFSPQFTPGEKDTAGFTLVKRYASLLNSTQNQFGK